jgi:hypothetical protein
MRNVVPSARPELVVSFLIHGTPRQLRESRRSSRAGASRKQGVCKSVR